MYDVLIKESLNEMGPLTQSEINEAVKSRWKERGLRGYPKKGSVRTYAHRLYQRHEIKRLPVAISGDFVYYLSHQEKEAYRKGRYDTLSMEIIGEIRKEKQQKEGIVQSDVNEPFVLINDGKYRWYYHKWPEWARIFYTICIGYTDKETAIEATRSVMGLQLYHTMEKIGIEEKAIVEVLAKYFDWNVAQRVRRTIGAFEMYKLLSHPEGKSTQQ